jgi:phage-related protein
LSDLRKPIAGSETAVTACDVSQRRRAGDVGHQLNSVQAGRPAKDWKPMPLFGPGVIEIRVRLESEYRVFYLAKFEEAVYVLHAFVKKTQKSSSLDIELGRSAIASCWKGGSDASYQG